MEVGSALSLDGQRDHPTGLARDFSFKIKLLNGLQDRRGRSCKLADEVVFGHGRRAKKANERVVEPGCFLRRRGGQRQFWLWLLRGCAVAQGGVDVCT